MTTDPRLPRLYALLAAAEALADARSSFGKQARELLPATTGLSPEGVDHALRECLEHRAGRSTLSQWIRRASPSPRSHVLLSANVFTAAFRSIALALAQSEHVFVRASRREPVFPRLLEAASGGAFQLVPALSPTPGDHFWAYGTDATLAEVRRGLPSGVRFHGHGSGMGVAVFEPTGTEREGQIDLYANALAEDVVAFDQRGCASPRLVLVHGSDAHAREMTKALARALTRWEDAVPRGALFDDERAEAERYAVTMTYVGGAESAGKGLVVHDPVADRLFLPPVGRYLGVVRISALDPILKQLDARLTTVGVAGHESLPGRVQALLGKRRVVDWGKMQKPALDGPLDLRTNSEDDDA